MNVKISVFVICVEVIIYLSLYNLHDCSFKNKINQSHKLFTVKKAFFEELLFCATLY